MLRDNGCNGVVIRRNLFTESQLTGITRVLMLMDQSLTEVPTARYFVKTPIYSGEQKRLSTTVYVLVIGHIEGLHSPCPIDRENPPHVEANASDVAVTADTPAADEQVTGCAVETRNQQKSREKPTNR